MQIIKSFSCVNPIIKNLSPRITSAEVYLSSSILLETACTLCLSNVNKNKLWMIPIYTGYGISFYLFPKCLDKYTLNFAYTVWSGVGIISTFLLDIALKRQTLRLKNILGIFAVIYGIYLLHL